MLTILLVVLSLLGFPAIAFAQSQGIDPGLNQVGAVVPLSGEDPRVIVVRLINVALSVLGIITLVLVLYAGFTWMTSGGSEEKVSRAKTILRNAVIGLVIILSSWAITRFILTSLTDAVNGPGTGTQQGGGSGGPGGSFGSGGGAAGFRLEGVEPAGSVPLRNVQVRFLFSQEVTPQQASEHIRVVEADGGAAVPGSLQLDGRLVTFTPTEPCPAPYADRFCFDADTAYVARVATAMRSATGQAIGCGGLGASCEQRFVTGSQVDATAPQALFTQPFDGQAVSQNALVELGGIATDDSGISLVEFSADNQSVTRVTPSQGTSPQRFTARGFWNTQGVSLGQHTLAMTAFDADSNRVTSSPVRVTVRPASCFNRVQDPGEDAIDCGGSCGACTGGTCQGASDCRSSVCTAGRCVEAPVITGMAPNDGAVGTFVTISGLNFGASAGEVTFTGGVTARVPARCAEFGSGWTPTAVVVEVPVGAQTGPVTIKNGTSSLSDTTNNTNGPDIGVFTVSTTTHPGLCAVTPDRGAIGTVTRLVGVGFGAQSDRVYVGDALVTAFRSWTDQEVGLAIPPAIPGFTSVRVRVGDRYSNPVPFQVQEVRSTEPPIIQMLEPARGPIGEYITLRGRNFGSQAGSVRVFASNGAEGLADTTFPPACDVATRYWSDTAVTIKIPATLRAQGLGGTTPVTPGSYQVALQRADGSVMSGRASLEVIAGAPGPGLCALAPNTGPVGTEVRFTGERFGTQSGTVRFTGEGTPAPALSIVEWTDQSVRAIVPPGARTGAVSIETSGQSSNPLPYTVRNCNEDTSICSETERCCEGSGVCVAQAGGQCPLLSREAHYAWRFSSGEIPVYPEVVEECNPSSRRLASPSPWAGRPGGAQACVNADLVIRFTTVLDPGTVNGATVIVRACPSADGDCSSGTVVTPATGFPRVESASTDTSLIRFRPGTTDGKWQAASHYQITLTTGIQSPRRLAMPAREQACGAGNAYCFRFSTRNSTASCAIGSVLVSPGVYGFTDVDQSTDVHANPLAADDTCLQLNPEGYAWTWTVRDAQARTDGRVNVTQLAGPQGHLPDQTATSRAEVPVTDPSRVTASVTVGRATISGYGEMTVAQRPFIVDSYGPNCDEACINAAAWAAMSVAVRPESVTPSTVELRRCGDARCTTMDEPLVLSQGGLRVVGLPEVAAPQGLGRLILIDPGVPLRTGQYYRVLLKSGASVPGQGIVSTRGQAIASLNSEGGFSWTFKTKTDNQGLCTVDRVLVAPDEKIESEIGARQRFTALPFSAPDRCSTLGQMLGGTRSYAWSSVLDSGSPDTDVARLVLRNDNTPAAGSTASVPLTDQSAPVRAGASTSDQQLVEIIASRDPGEGQTRVTTNIRATTEGKTGSAVYGLQCGLRAESACRAGHGLTSGGCCAPRPTIVSRYPAVAATGVCRNTAVFADFSVPINQESLEQKIFLAERVSAVTCPAQTRTIEEVLRGTQTSWLRRTWLRVLGVIQPSSATANVWCVGAVPARLTVSSRGSGSRVEISIERALKANTEYRVYVRGEASLSSPTRQGIRSDRQVLMEQEVTTWTFTTGTGICQANAVTVTDTNTDSPYLFTRHPESHTWSAMVTAAGPTGPAPIVPVVEYAWTWQDWVSSHTNVLNLAAVDGGDRARSQVQTQARNGRSLIAARLQVTADTISTPSTVGRIFEGAEYGTVRLCERPWPSRDVGPFTDAPGSVSLRLMAPALADGPFFHFSTGYCRDAGDQGDVGDLPELRLAAAPIGRAEADQGIVRQYLFTFEDPRFRGDGIGIRIADNPTHLSARDWYAARGFRGTPQAVTVDGYDAIRDGNTVYISASNVDVTGRTVSSTVYIVSHNPGAKAETVNIVNQLIENFSLNVNVTRSNGNVCVTPSAQGGESLLNNRAISCSADWECAGINPLAVCASAKAKLQRDRVRIGDFYAMGRSLDALKTSQGKYPALPSGSFVAGMSTSRWPSWSQSLAGAGSQAAFPVDPVNRFVSCGRCQATDGTLGKLCSETSECGQGESCVSRTGDDPTRNGFDPATCWNAQDQLYMCPAFPRGEGVPAQTSHVYQYRSINDGARYELSTILEGSTPSAYRPALPTVTMRRCTNVDRACATDRDCGVGTTSGPTGSCRAAGGSWNFAATCENTLYTASAACTMGAPLASGQVCRLGQTRTEACQVNGQAGTKIQVCSDCAEFVDGPQTVCTPNVQCGNGRVDTGEVCDDGARNGQYGFCSRTCQAPEGACGDGLIGTGEMCDNGSPAGRAINGTPPGVNGAYCGVGCTVAQSCGLDCRSRAPHCGDNVVSGPEQCDGNTQQTQKALCAYPDGSLGDACDDQNPCANGGVCGGDNPAAQSCSSRATIQLCSGGTRNGASCTGDGDCGAGGRCVSNSYPTYHVRTCNPAGSEQQCRFATWSACRPLASCGNGVIDPGSGEECDDGVSGNSGSGRCTPQCRLNTCGDGFANAATEQCDFGERNGVQPSQSSIPYGSVGQMCTRECRLAAVSGGYCGNNRLDPGEACDGTVIQEGTTCRALGFDYASVTAQDGVERLSCSNRCQVTGCEVCSSRLAPTPENTISAVVRDGILQNVGLRGARVILRYNGSPVAETTTDSEGRFSFAGLHMNAACGNYTIAIGLQGVRMTYEAPAGSRQLVASTDPNSGYFPYTSPSFTYEQFAGRVGSSGEEIVPGRVGLPVTENGVTSRVILLMPRPGTGETYVIREWQGGRERQGQLIDPQLLLPVGMGYTYAQNSNPSTYTRCAQQSCEKTINWAQDWSSPRRFDRRGSLNLGVAPHAGLACYEADGSNTCSSPAAIAETILYRRFQPVAGVYRYFLVDYMATLDDISPAIEGNADRAAARVRQQNDLRNDGEISSPALRNKVRIAWRDAAGTERYQEVVPPSVQAGDPCQKYWYVFDQDAVTGAISLVNRFMCDRHGITDNSPQSYVNVNGTFVHISALLTDTQPAR